MTPGDVWPQRDAFRERVRQWLAQNPGSTREDLADLLNVTPETLRQIFSNRKKNVGPRLRERMAEVFRCDLNEFLSNPGSPPPGASIESYAASTEEERVMIRAISSDLARLTEKQRRAAFESWSAFVRAMTN